MGVALSFFCKEAEQLWSIYDSLVPRGIVASISQAACTFFKAYDFSQGLWLFSRPMTFLKAYEEAMTFLKAYEEARSIVAMLT